MARIRVINPQGQSGTIDDSELQMALSSGYTVPGQQSGGFLKNIIGSLISPFKRTGERAVGATQEIGLNRAGRIDEANTLMKEAQKRMMAGDMSPEVKSMLDRAEQISKASSRETVATRNQQQLTDPLQIAKDTAAMLSWGVPAKGISGLGKVGTRALGGAASGFGYSPETSLEGLLASTAGGAGTSVMTGAILDKLFPGKVPTKEAVTDIVPEEQVSISKKDMRALRKQMGMVSGDISTKDPNWFAKSVERQKNLQAMTTPGSDTFVKAEQLTNQLKNLQNKKNAILSASTNTVDANDLKTFLTSYVKDKVRGNMLDETLLNSQIDDMISRSSGGQVTGQLIDDLRVSLPNVSQSYAKASAGASPNIAAQETAKGLERALKEALNVLEPEASKLSSDMAPIYELLPALQKSAKASYRLPVIGEATAIKPVVESIADISTRMGRPVESTVSGVSQAPIKSLLSTVAQAIPPALPAAVTRKQPSAQPTGGVTPTGTQVPQGTDILSQLGLDSQSLMLLQLLPAKEQNAILSDLIGKAVTGDKGAGNLQLISDAAAKAYEKLASGSVKTGVVGGRAEKVKGQLGLKGDQETLDFNVAIDNIFSAIAKVRGGTALTDSEKQLLRNYLPQTGDSKQILETKLRYIIQNPDVVVLK